ncbi:MAG: bifunctional 5,10-methylene-tetrahydrofolate dehydrogenase/5,10-methylene-tetrahydrofolate cyclohydrolase [Bacteroidia bacterium]|nr:bifunctional 5,10-methylene-tetrahydrofolate dehydrogenase/5,10-methylene-tetrahydrofolate cyclohydrolase [Bacteroidia bacterium]
MNLLDGKVASAVWKYTMAEEVKAMVSKGQRPPHLCAILVGNNGASETYVASKVKNCAEVGFESSLIRFEDTITEVELLQKIKEINLDDSIDGLIVQLPLPPHISVQKVTEAISPAKDVDGFHPINSGRMLQNLPCYIPATPYGILLLLEHFKISTTGKSCAIIGRSNIVGMPMSVLMALNNEPGNCTVTLCHSRTKDLGAVTSKSDIIIAALGKPYFLKADMVKEGAIVIDVGITRVTSEKTKSGFKLAGDVDFENVAPKCSWISPVPGGVGLMTIIGLLKNTLRAAKKEISF